MVDIKLVLVLDGVGPNCMHILNMHGIQTVYKSYALKEDLMRDIHAFDAMVVGPDIQITRDVLAVARRLKTIALASPGCGGIDIEAASNFSISVINAPNSNVLSASEFICGLILAVAKQVRPALAAFSNGLWNYGLFKGYELKDRTIAIIGCGRVGKEVARRMSAFGMKIVGYDPLLARTQSVDFYSMKEELYEIWPIADYILVLGDYVLYSIMGFDPFATEEQCRKFYDTKMEPCERPAFSMWLDFHVPLLRPNRNFINADVLQRCKTGVKIINVGRDGLINEGDLLNALNSGKVGGAAIDVFDRCVGRLGDPLTLSLIKHPSVIATPHIATATTDVPIHAAREIAEQIVNLVKPGTYNTTMFELNKVHDRLF